MVLLCRVPYVRRVLDSSDGTWKLRWTLNEQWHTSRAVDDCCWEAGVVGMRRYPLKITMLSFADADSDSPGRCCRRYAKQF